MGDFYTKFLEFAGLSAEFQILKLHELTELAERPDHIRTLAALPAKVKNSEDYMRLFRAALKRVNLRICCCKAKKDFAKDLADHFRGQPWEQQFFKRYLRMLSKWLHKEGIRPPPASPPPPVESIGGRVRSREIRSEREWRHNATVH